MILLENYCSKIIRWIVRRLTPTECERLQGYPDGWTDLGEWVDSKGKTHKAADTPRYKALGNSIALPQWYYVLGGIADRLPDNATLGSLFDGIGGFPYVWAQLHDGRKELCVWASEIEEFPIAVTKNGSRRLRMENYFDFVVHKSERAVHTDSIALTVDDLNNKLYDFQKTSCGGRWQRAAPLFCRLRPRQDRDAA